MMQYPELYSFTSKKMIRLHKAAQTLRTKEAYEQLQIL